MKDGLYRVQFRTPLGEGAGVLVVRGEELQGGDSTMYYVGTHKSEGARLTASVRAMQHTDEPDRASVFGVPEVTIALSGTVNGGRAKLTGGAKEAPGLSFTAELTMLEPAN